MCGICGLMDLENRTGLDLENTVESMTGSLSHRGPDAGGIWSDSGIALGHRRLSIIDLAGSAQPMSDANKRFVITFNGEIYNYLELREDLEKQGVRFESKGDTEVLLAAYATYGPDCLKMLNGMFAFAVWDRRDQVLFAARDRMGVKPLFYGEKDGLFAFASELQALRGLPLDFSLSPESLRDYLRYGFIWSPDTIFQGVRELRPAHYLLKTTRKTRIEKYWHLPSSNQTLRDCSVDELAEELRYLVNSAVSLRLRSDVPLGAFLSGGLDSSIIVAAMRSLGKTETHTFSIGFSDSSFDESESAREVADFLGTRHHESRAELKPDLLIGELAAHYGQPYGDSSAIPTWHLSKNTREHVTVALSGDGADELFCGYRRYIARYLLFYYQKLPALIRDRVIGALLDRLPEGTGYYDSSLIKKMRLFCALDRRVRQDPTDIYPAYFNRTDLEELLGGECREKVQGYVNVRMFPDNRDGWVEMMMRSDLLHYLPDDILTKVDRASMAHALEVRSPFMDYRLVEFAASLPLSFKLKGQTTKYLLRRAFARDLPPPTLAKKKHGFAVPVGEWFQNELREMFADTVLTGNAGQLIDKGMARRLLEEHQRGRVDHGYRLWLLLFLHVWQQWWNDRT